VDCAKIDGNVGIAISKQSFRSVKSGYPHCISLGEHIREEKWQQMEGDAAGGSPQ
jgi:hypothetical protein